MKNMLLDSGFWIALYTPSDRWHLTAQSFLPELEANQMLIPWPSLYEFVNTRFIRRPENLSAFERFLLHPNVLRISDEPYRALERVFEISKSGFRAVSLVDEVIRRMMLDRQNRVDYLVSFNRSDFEYDCQMAEVILLSG